jgi:hypothetical protein
LPRHPRRTAWPVSRLMSDRGHGGPGGNGLTRSNGATEQEGRGVRPARFAAGNAGRWSHTVSCFRDFVAFLRCLRCSVTPCLRHATEIETSCHETALTCVGPIGGASCRKHCN